MQPHPTAEPATNSAQNRQNHGPIDLDHLARQTMGDLGLEAEVLRLFGEMSQAYFHRLEESTTVEDMLRHLHTMKGAAAGVGAFALMDLARHAEAELRAGSPVNPEWVDDMAMALEEISAFISRRIGAVAA